MRMCRSSSVPSDRSCGDRRCRISKDKKCRSCCLKTHWGFHCFANANFPKKTNNPNPSPIGNKFGLFLFGPSGENRTHGLLNPIQARYQNCATPGYRAPLPYRSVATRDIIRRVGAFVNHFLQFFRVFLQKVRFLRTGALFIVVLPAAVPCPFPAGA